MCREPHRPIGTPWGNEDEPAPAQTADQRLQKQTLAKDRPLRRLLRPGRRSLLEAAAFRGKLLLSVLLGPFLRSTTPVSSAKLERGHQWCEWIHCAACPLAFAFAWF